MVDNKLCQPFAIVDYDRLMIGILDQDPKLTTITFIDDAGMDD